MLNNVRVKRDRSSTSTSGVVSPRNRLPRLAKLAKLLYRLGGQILDDITTNAISELACHFTTTYLDIEITFFINNFGLLYFTNVVLIAFCKAR